MSSVFPINGQPSSPGMWVSELRLGGVKLIGGEARFCSDIALLRRSRQSPAVTFGRENQALDFRLAASFCKSGALIVGIATRPGPVSVSATAAFSFSMILAITA